MRGPTEVPPPPGQFGGVCNINIHHPSGSSTRRCPSPGILGSNITTDPGGEPLPPDQSPFSVRRRSVATRGEIITKPPGVDSARHPGNMNGNDSSRAGQRVAAWPDFPHEKQTTPFQSRLMGRCRVGGLTGCCPERYDRNNFSNPTGSGVATAASNRRSMSSS